MTNHGEGGQEQEGPQFMARPLHFWFGSPDTLSHVLLSTPVTEEEGQVHM